MNNIISNGNWSFLCNLGLRYRRAAGTLTCTPNLERVARGMYNVAVELAFSDGVFWIARIRLPDGGNDGDRETEVLSEIATMKLVAQRTSIPIPVVHSYEFKANNPFGFPYMLMTALPGRALSAHFAFSVPREFQPKIAAQIADLISQLSQITFPEIGQVWAGDEHDEEPHIIPFSLCGKILGPFNSSTACFRGMQRAMDGANLDKHKAESDRLTWRRYSEICTKAIPLIVYPELRRGPFPLWHRDLHFKNILVDDEYNITGVLDWTGARVAPWEKFAIYGDIMPFNHFSEEENRPIMEFRQTLIEAFRQLEVSRPTGFHGTPLSDMLGSGVADLVRAWGNRVPDAEMANGQALQLLRLLFGEDTTLDNHEARRRMLSGRRAGVTGPIVLSRQRALRG
jgi:aminoglycoside phosphotransferase (APT) family kinase protein